MMAEGSLVRIGQMEKWGWVGFACEYGLGCLCTLIKIYPFTDCGITS